MPQLIDLTGRRFGRLVVLHRSAERGRSGQTKWDCLCDCGIPHVTWGQSLRRGESTSCGCFHRERTAANNSLRPFQALYNKLKRLASKRGLVMTLTYDEFINLTLTRCCHYCRVALYWAEYKRDGEYFGYNLDRKDPSQGYTEENCVACCKRCNQCKSDQFTYVEWVEIGKVIRRLRESAVSDCIKA